MNHLTMNFMQAKEYFITLASVFILGFIGPGCSSIAENGGSGQTNTDNTQGKNIPAISAPAVNYNFYKPTTEEALKADTNYGYLIAKAKPGFKETTFNKFGMKVVGRLEANGAVYYRLFAEGSVMGALKDAKMIGGLMYIEPELKYYLHDVTSAPIDYNMPDPYIAREQWGAYASKAFDAWITYGFGPNKPVVAAIDSGVRFNHDDLTNVVKHAYSWWNRDYNDFHPDIDTIDFTNNLELPDYRVLDPEGIGTDPQMGHGTHTAGTICAEGNNGVGVAGVCWNVDFISYAGYNIHGGATLWTIFGSLWHLANWKTKNNYTATIPVNMSLGGLYASQFIVDMVEYALEHGVMVVASSGNDGYRIHTYPAAYQGVMAVGATNGADKRAAFSNWGSYISVAAPGESIISTINDTNASYINMSGTSMAAPHVTGLIGYMLTFNPDLKPDQIKTYVEQNADYINGQTGFSEETGWGRINVLKTIGAVVNDMNAQKAPPSNYIFSPVKIKSPIADLIVHLYRCDAQGKILNYVASSVSGNSEVTDAKGMAYFNLLRPGHYMAIGSVAADTVGRTDVFEVKAGQSAPDQELVFGRQFLTIQTMATMDWVNTGGSVDTVGDHVDAEIWIYDSESGDPIYYYDWYIYDTFIVPMPDKPGAYWIRITNYDDPDGYYGDNHEGEYAMWVTLGEPYVGVQGGNSNYGSPLLAPGAYAYPLPEGVGVKSQHSQSRPTAQPIDFDKLYYGRFNGPNGTSGTIGHYYKFVVVSE
jgi:thermitase